MEQPPSIDSFPNRNLFSFDIDVSLPDVFFFRKKKRPADLARSKVLCQLPFLKTMAHSGASFFKASKAFSAFESWAVPPRSRRFTKCSALRHWNIALKTSGSAWVSIAPARLPNGNDCIEDQNGQNDKGLHIGLATWAAADDPGWVLWLWGPWKMWPRTLGPAGTAHSG